MSYGAPWEQGVSEADLMSLLQGWGSEQHGAVRNWSGNAATFIASVVGWWRMWPAWLMTGSRRKPVGVAGGHWGK